MAGEPSLAEFFELMKKSCERQGNLTPNPNSLQRLQALWNSAGGSRRIQLAMARKDGEPVAGLLGIAFGERVTLWKKGWSGKFGDLRPNELVMDASLAAAKARGEIGRAHV